MMRLPLEATSNEPTTFTYRVRSGQVVEPAMLRFPVAHAALEVGGADALREVVLQLPGFGMFDPFEDRRQPLLHRLAPFESRLFPCCTTLAMQVLFPLKQAPNPSGLMMSLHCTMGSKEVI